MICRNQLGELAERSEDFEVRGATLVAVSSDEAAETAEWAKDKGIDLVFASDPGGRVIGDWGLREEGETRSVPATFIVDRQGRIRFRQIGESLTERAEIDDLLSAIPAP